MYTLQYRKWLKGETEHASSHDDIHPDKQELKKDIADAINSIETVRTRYHDCIESDDESRDDLEIAEIMLTNMAREMNVQQPTGRELRIADKSAELLGDAKERLSGLLNDQLRIDDESPCATTSDNAHDYSKAVAKVNEANHKLNHFIKEIVDDML